ncbi:tandem-95 repeat protein, partial [bacterium]|nr:tandem-95 repeat protein [bacterium]
MLNRIYSLFSVILVTAIGFTQFNPTVSYDLSNPLEDQSSDLTFTILQAQGETDMAEFTISSSSGSFDFSGWSEGDSIGVGNGTFDQGATEVTIRLNVFLMSEDGLEVSAVATIIASNSDEYAPGDPVSGMTFANSVNGGTSIFVVSPDEPGGGTTTQGYTSSLTINNFIVPEALTFDGSFTSELSDNVLTSVVMDLNTFDPTISIELSDIEESMSNQSDFTFTVVQESGEIDLVEIDLDGSGIFNINRNAGALIGNGSFVSPSATVSVELNVSNPVNPDPLAMDIVATISESDDLLNYPIGESAGGISILNNYSEMSFHLQAISPTEPGGGTTTAGYTSSLTINNLFLNSGLNPFTWDAALTSELGNVDNISGTIELTDCNGDLSGSASYDDCGVCAGGNTGLEPNADQDCAGVCDGNAVEDCLGECGGDATDLGCGCGGGAPIDYCFDWDGDGLGAGTPIADCGEISLPLDYVDNCDDQTPFGQVGIAFDGVDNTLESNGTISIGYTSDVAIHAFEFEVDGVEIVSASTVVEGFTVNVENNIISGTATESGYVANSGGSLTVLTYVYGPSSEATLPGGGSVTTLEGQSPNLVFGGGIPVAEPPADCFGVYNGPAELDDCGVCDGGNALNLGCGCDLPGPAEYYNDGDGDGLGFGTVITVCADVAVANGYVTNNTDTQPDCATNDEDCLGVCGGAADTDTNDDCCVPADLDDCGLCNGDGSTCNSPIATDQTVPAFESTPVTFDLNVTDPSDPPSEFVSLTVSWPSHGFISYTPGATVSVTYTPTENYIGEDSFTYTVFDGTYTSNSATVTITVNEVNDDPVASNISTTTNEDTPVSFELSGTDEETDGLTFNIASQPSNGSVALTNRAISDSYTYTPNPNYNGSDSFTYTVFDGENTSAPATVSITVSPVNDAPVITGTDVLTFDEGGSIELFIGYIDITDVDSETYTLAVHSVSKGLINGTTISLDQQDVDFNGTISAVIQVHDGSDDDDNPVSNTFTMSITVNPVNDAPVAANDTYNATEDQVLVIDGIDSNGVLDNDYDVDSAILTSAVLADPSNGSVSLASDGTFTYTPDDDYYGDDSFTYTVSDDNNPAGTDVGTVNIDVSAVNDPSICTSFLIDCVGLSPCFFNSQVLDPDDLLYTLYFEELLGGLINQNVVREGEEWQYTGDGSTPFDVVLYGANDGDTDSELARIDFINLPSTSRNFSRALTAYDSNSSLSEDAVSSISLVATDFDADITGATIAITYSGNGTVGTPVLDAEISDENVQIWNVDFTPEADFVGADSFTFTVNGTSIGTVDITLNNVNDAPVLAIDDHDTNEGTEYSNTVAATDVDPSDVSTYAVLNGPAGLVIDANSGVLSGWTPGNDEVGDHIIEIQATDDGTDPGSLSTNTSYTVTVLNVNDVPVIDDQVVLTTVEETDLTITLADLSVTDPDNLYPDDFTLSVGAGSNYSVLGATITPDTDFNGDLTVPATVNDGTDDSASFDLTVTVTAVNDAPTLAAIADPTAVDEDGDNVSVSFTPMDVEATDFLSVSVSVSNDALFPDGSISVVPEDEFSGVARTVTLNPADNLSGSSVVIVEVTDGALTAVQQFTVTVNPTNDAPVLNAIGDLSFDEDTEFDYTATASDIDNDQGDLQYSVLGGDELTISAAFSGNVVTFTTAADYNGSESFTIAVADADFDFDSEIITVTVDPVNDAPVITSTAGTTARTSEEYTYQATATDVDEDTYAYALSNEPAGMLVSESGLVTWSPSAGTFTSGTVTLTVSDGGDASDSEIFTISVAQVDCAGVDDGDAEIDDCGVCSGGTSGHEANSDQDCAGTCFGTAALDDCGVCAGGFVEPQSLLVANADQDCAGICFGDAVVDDCDVC